MIFINIAIFFVSLAFGLISIYIAKLLMRLSALIATLGQTLDNVERQLDNTIVGLEKLIVETERTYTDVESKLLATDALFLSLGNVGEATSIVSGDLLSRTKNYAKESSLPGTKPFVRFIQCSEFAFVLFNSWKRGKKISL